MATATNNAANEKFANNSDGFLIGGGATERDLTVTGGNITITGANSNTYTFPSATSTLASLGLAETFSGIKTFSAAPVLNAKISTYNSVATAGGGIPAIYGAGRATAQAAANASVATYTNGAADGSFVVSANVLITASTTFSFTVTAAYTDEGNTSRTLTLSFSNVGGTIATTIANTGGAVPYEGVPMHIRCKASTAITIATTGTFTSVTYNVEGYITQLG